MREERESFLGVYFVRNSSAHFPASRIPTKPSTIEQPEQSCVAWKNASAPSPSFPPLNSFKFPDRGIRRRLRGVISAGGIGIKSMFPSSCWKRSERSEDGSPFMPQWLNYFWAFHAVLLESACRQFLGAIKGCQIPEIMGTGNLVPHSRKPAW